MKRIILSITFLSLSLISYAQEDGKGKIDTQRPTLTESYSIIIPNMLQFENGIDYYGNSSFAYGSFIRGSVSKRVELRLFTDYKSLSTVGAKFIVLEPDSAFLGIGASFVYFKDLKNNANEFRLAMTKNFGKLYSTYNLGNNSAGLYNILLLGTPLGDKFNYFVEYFNDPTTNRIHSGITWIPKRDVQLDLNGGWMTKTGLYAGLGLSFRLR